MSEALAEAARRIDAAGRLVLTSHDRPDGDALGSALGLARILRQRGRTVELCGCRPFPERYRFLLREDERFAETVRPNAPETDLLVVTDSGAASRSGPTAAWLEAGGSVLNLDHHVDNPGYGAWNVVDPESSSASELVAALARQAGWTVPAEAADALWVGLVTDTGRFSYENTSAATLACGAFLVERGVRPQALAGPLFHCNPPGAVRLAGRATATLRFSHGGTVALIVLDEEDFLAAGCPPEEAGEIIDLARDIKGVRVALYLRAHPGEPSMKLSIRTRPPLDATALARRFNGGGHQRAAGGFVRKSLAEATGAVLAAVDELWAEALAEPQKETCP